MKLTETTRSHFPLPSAIGSAPLDVLVESFELENSSQTVPTRRITLETRPPNQSNRDAHSEKRTRADDDFDSALLSVYQNDLGNVSGNLTDDKGVFSGTEMLDMLDGAWLAIKTKSQKSELSQKDVCNLQVPVQFFLRMKKQYHKYHLAESDH